MREIAFQDYLNTISGFNIMWRWAAGPVEAYLRFTLHSQVQPFSEGYS